MWSAGISRKGARTMMGVIRYDSGGQFKLSEGEIHYLYWYIQGSIMVPDIRKRLRRAWGFCERHAWAALLVEAGFRSSFMHGPAILYEDILGSAISALDVHGPFKNLHLRRNLRERGPCMMCEMGFGPETKGKASPDVIERGGDSSNLRVFAEKTKKYWKRAVCGRCFGQESFYRCRKHLIEDASNGSLGDIPSHRDVIDYIFEHLVIYARSFRWECKGTDTEEDRAALISAVGWCSGWSPLLSILEMNW
jgi:hypothetical protein